MPESVPADQFTICTQLCKGRCCRYVSIPIDPPRAAFEWDRMRWWLAHEGVTVSKDDEGWTVHVMTRCSHLGADNACGIYAHNMDVCDEYDASICEFTGPLEYDFEFQSEADLAAYIERRGLKRGAEVARSIRAAEAAR
jgi:Fe-S-cluster containining protein